MQEQLVTVGIIGCGGIALGKHLPALAKQARVKLVAFCDLNREKAERAAKEYGVDDAKVYTDYLDLLADSSIRVIHVCTPNASHATISIAALEAGKDVLCEKPMAKTSLEAKAMVEAAKRTGRKLCIGYQNRYRADAQFLKQACEQGELGEIYYAKAQAVRRRAVPTWGVFLDEEQQGGGPLIDIGTHALDLTLWMMDNYKPKAVMGTSFHKLGQKKDAANAWGSWDPEKFTVEDSAFGFIVMENGATIVLESSWALNTLSVGEARCVLCGTEGGADMEDGLRFNGERYQRLYEEKIDLSAGGVAFYSGSQDEPGDIESRLWIDAVLDDKIPYVTAEQAYVVTQILEAIYESAKTGKAIYFN
nr:Gfo/Idh/MocA family oxidoreductase [Bacilli bacterium]